VPARRAAHEDVGQAAGGVVGVVIDDGDAVDVLGGRDDAAAVVRLEALDEEVESACAEATLCRLAVGVVLERCADAAQRGAGEPAAAVVGQTQGADGGGLEVGVVGEGQRRAVELLPDDDEVRVVGLAQQAGDGAAPRGRGEQGPS